MKTLLQLAPIRAQTDADPGPDWRTQAACKGQDTERFFPHPSDRDGEDAAVAVCWQCPVEADCLADAMQVEKGLSASNRWGIWGGYGPVERVMLERMQGQGERRATSEAGVQLDNPECQVELTHNKKAAPAGNRSLTATTAKES